MIIDAHAIPGAYTHAHFRRILPFPNADIERQLRRFVRGTGLTSDATIGVRDPRLQHCILLPGPGLIVTATRAHAPLLGSHCADIARITNLAVLLLRMGERSGPASPLGVCACLIRCDAAGHLVGNEGYRATVPAQGGILLRHPSGEVLDYQVSHTGIAAIDDAALA